MLDWQSPIKSRRGIIEDDINVWFRDIIYLYFYIISVLYNVKRYIIVFDYIRRMTRIEVVSFSKFVDIQELSCFTTQLNEELRRKIAFL